MDIHRKCRKGKTTATQMLNEKLRKLSKNGPVERKTPIEGVDEQYNEMYY